MELASPADKAAEIEKLSRAISDELDAALMEHEIIAPQDCRSYEQLSPIERAAIQSAARRLYGRIVYDTANGVIRVVDSTGTHLGGV